MTLSTENTFSHRAGRLTRHLTGLVALSLLAAGFGSGCCMTGACGGGSLFQMGGMAGGGCSDVGCDSCGVGDIAMGGGLGGGMGCAAGGCGAGGCDDCGGGSEIVYPGSAGGCSMGCGGGPGSFLLPLLSTRLSCGGGCGDVYWNEWISDPPECCDACNDDGCWVGPNCGGGCGGGCGMGPCVLVHGAWQGVTNLARGVLAIPGSLLSGRGYGGGMMSNGYSASCDGSGGCGAIGCDSCAQTTPTQAGQFLSNSPTPGMNHRVVANAAAATHATGMGTGVVGGNRIQPASAQAAFQPLSKRPHRLVSKRLRR